VHQHVQKVARVGYGPAWAGLGLVFTSAGGNALSARNVVTAFKRLTAAAQLPAIRFHDLRHSHATLLLREGVPAKIVSERLGHASIAITLDTYAHVLPDMQQVAVDAYVSGLFGSDRVPVASPHGRGPDTRPAPCLDFGVSIRVSWSRPPDSNRRPAVYESYLT
jgi:hypothetical protein